MYTYLANINVCWEFSHSNRTTRSSRVEIASAEIKAQDVSVWVITASRQSVRPSLWAAAVAAAATVSEVKCIPYNSEYNM